MGFQNFLTPAVILAIATAVVGLIVRAVQIQTAVTAQAAFAAALRESVEEQQEILAAHRTDFGAHFDPRFQAELDRRFEQRFKSIERQLGEISKKLDRLAGI